MTAKHLLDYLVKIQDNGFDLQTIDVLCCKNIHSIRQSIDELYFDSDSSLSTTTQDIVLIVDFEGDIADYSTE